MRSILDGIVIKQISNRVIDFFALKGKRADSSLSSTENEFIEKNTKPKNIIVMVLFLLSIGIFTYLFGSFYKGDIYIGLKLIGVTPALISFKYIALFVLGIFAAPVILSPFLLLIIYGKKGILLVKYEKRVNTQASSVSDQGVFFEGVYATNISLVFFIATFLGIVSVAILAV